MVQQINSIKVFQSQIPEVIDKFPTLKIADGDDIYITGTIDIIDNSGKKWDTFSIEIRPSEAYPYRFPMLLETSKKIPRIPDWHINSDGSCCVDVEPNEILFCRNGITVLRYLTEKAIPFLSNQAYRRVEGFYANGEYPHGIEGIFLFYSRILRSENIQVVLKLLNFIIRNGRPDRRSICFCGSRTKFRHCHRDAYDTIKLMSNDLLIKHYIQIQSLLK
jgi:hypothetical protein